MLPKKAYADDTYNDLKTADYAVISKSIYEFSQRSCGISVKDKKNSNVANNIFAREISVNNFFAHWIKEIDIKCLGDDIAILLTTNKSIFTNIPMRC